MCVVSAIHDYGMRQPDDFWTRGRFDEFKDLVRKGQDFDIKTSQPHCEDPEKVKLMARIEAMLKEGEEVVPPALYGSDFLPAVLELAGEKIALGDIVRQAFVDSGLTPDAWNALDGLDREKRLTAAVWLIRAKITAEKDPNPPWQEPASVYGYCPTCGEPGVTRARSPNGKTICRKGHSHPHAAFKDSP
jgi:hypothetical protein